jgi:hypothetical protein
LEQTKKQVLLNVLCRSSRADQPVRGSIDERSILPSQFSDVIG